MDYDLNNGSLFKTPQKKYYIGSVNVLSTNERTKERESQKETLQLGKYHDLANRGSPRLTKENQAFKLKTIIIRAFVMLPSKRT